LRIFRKSRFVFLSRVQREMSPLATEGYRARSSASFSFFFFQIKKKNIASSCACKKSAKKIFVFSKSLKKLPLYDILKKVIS